MAGLPANSSMKYPPVVASGGAGNPEHMADAVRALPGVQTVETRIVVTADLEVPGFADPVLGRLVSLPEHGPPLLNLPHVRTGRFPEPGRLDEVLVSEAFAARIGRGSGEERLGRLLEERHQQVAVALKRRQR